MDIFTLLMLDKHLQLNVNFQKKTNSQKLSYPKNTAQCITGAVIIIIPTIVIIYPEILNSESNALTKDQGESVYAQVNLSNVFYFNVFISLLESRKYPGWRKACHGWYCCDFNRNCIRGREIDRVRTPVDRWLVFESGHLLSYETFYLLIFFF